MKLSTKIVKYGNPWGFRYSRGNEDIIDKAITFMVDLKTIYTTHSLRDADAFDKMLKDKGCTLLPLNECPVYNQTQVIMHYTTTTYSKWCNLNAERNAV